MNADAEKITLDEAAYEVKLASRRIALLHLAFARTLFNKLGPSRGKELVIEGIKAYGRMIGEEVRKGVIEQGLELTPQNYGAGMSRSMPKIGMHAGTETVDVDGEKRKRALGCTMAEVWKEYGENELGRLYCYVDPAKYMAYNPDFVLGHYKAVPDGDECCEFFIRRTTPKERADFAAEDSDWTYLDSAVEER